MPKISIIIAVYNMESYLSQCLDSLVHQTLQDIEIICVDDASTDHSLDRLQEYASRDSRIRILHYTENKSANMARKDGVLQSGGEFLLFVDADDYLELNACESLYERMQTEKVDILHFGTLVDQMPDQLSGGNPEWVKSANVPYYTKVEGDQIVNDCFIKKLFSYNLWGKLYNGNLCREAFSQISSRKLPRGQDVYNFFVIAFLAKSYLGIRDTNYYHYRYGAGMEGTKAITITQFEGYCLYSEVASEVKSFLDSRQIFSQFQIVYDCIRCQLLQHLIQQWMNPLERKEKSRGFELMLRYWPANELVYRLMCDYHSRQDEIVGYLEAFPFSTSRTIRTIGIFYYHFHNGGVERVISKLCQLFEKMGYQVYFFTDEPPSDQDYSLPEQTPRITLEREYRQAHFIPLSEKALSHKVDVMLHMYSNNDSLFWDVLALKLHGVSAAIRIPSIFTSDLLMTTPQLSGLPRIAKLADTMICLSDADRAYCEYFHSNVHTTINPFTYEGSDVVQAGLDHKNILYLGRFDQREKQVNHVLKAFSIIAAAEPLAKLYLVGDVEHFSGKEEFLDLAKELGITDQLVFCGYHTDARVFIQLCAAGIMTSSMEGYPNTLSEMQSFGLPVVMYDLPYLTYVKNNPGVIRVDMNRFDLLAGEVLRLLSDDSYRHRIGDAAYTFSQNLMDYDFETKWKEIFTSIENPPVMKEKDPAYDKMWNMIFAHCSRNLNIKMTRISELKEEINKLEKNKIVEQPAASVICHTDELSIQKEQLICDNQQLEAEIAQCYYILSETRHSISYRLGLMITFLPRKLRELSGGLGK